MNNSDTTANLDLVEMALFSDNVAAATTATTPNAMARPSSSAMADQMTPQPASPSKSSATQPISSTKEEEMTRSEKAVAEGIGDVAHSPAIPPKMVNLPAYLTRPIVPGISPTAGLDVSMTAKQVRANELRF